MSTLLIRTDATTQMGTGHVMRCLSLAQGWQDHGGKAVFLSHCESDSLRLRVENEGIDFKFVDSPHPDPVDLQATLSMLSELQGQWLVMDGYHFDQTYQQRVRRAGYRLLVIDDFAHLPEYHADILLNQNINAEQLPYSCDQATKMLLGPQYVLLRPEYMSWRSWHREIPQVAHKVLVTMGGGDPDNVTLKVIQAMEEMDLPGLQTRVIVGSVNPHLKMLNHALQRSNCNFQLLTDVSDMPEQMAWADLAVSAAGSTSWELAFMGLPSCNIILADNQFQVATTLHEQGATINLGWFHSLNSSTFVQIMGDLSVDQKRRFAMSSQGRRLVDGNGRRLVVAALHEYSGWR